MVSDDDGSGQRGAASTEGGGQSGPPPVAVYTIHIPHHLFMSVLSAKRLVNHEGMRLYWLDKFAHYLETPGAALVIHHDPPTETTDETQG